MKLPFRIALSIADKSTPSQISQHAKPAGSRAYRNSFPLEIDGCLQGQTWTADQLAAVTGGHWLVAPKPGFFVRSVIRGLSHRQFTDAPTLYVASEFEHLAFH